MIPNQGIDIPATRIAFALLAAMALTSLTACGGSSSTNSGATGTTVTASFAGATMPGAVAYQAGTTGQFQSLTLSGSSVSFTLPAGTTAYGFAYVCRIADVNFYSNESIIQAATTDTTSLSLACPSLSGSVSATFDVSAIPGATSTLFDEGYWSDQEFGTSGVQFLPSVPTGTFDVALVAMGADNTALGIQIQRGVNVTSSTSIAFPPMTAADELGSAPASITNVPSGATADFDTTYQTSGGLSALLPVSYATGVPQSTYPTVPSSQSQSGDFYLIQAGAIVSDPQYGSLNALVSSNTASAVTAALPSPLSSLAAPTAAAFPTFNANAGGFTVPGTVVNSSWTQFQANSTVYNTYTYVTNTWLGTNTTFTVPDLSTLNGFAPVPPSGGLEFWSLYSTAGTPLQFNPVQQSGVAFLSSPMSVQYVQTSGSFTVP